MIIQRIVLENYGLFSGRNEFDLQPNKPRPGRKTKRPIILFGGKNGAGKTTFLGAMRLLLYGRKSFDTKLSQADYEAALIGCLHRNKNAATRAPYAKIGLEFEHQVNGERALFYVERSWSLSTDNAVTEFFRVLKDGEPFEEIGKDHLEAFIGDIIPARLSQLFFFDGEKIKSIAEDLSSNAAIAEAIQSLLGLDHVLSLKADLKVYRSRLLKDSKSSSIQEALSEVEEKMAVTQRDLDALEEQRSELKTKEDGIQASLRALESTIESRGGGFAAQRKANQDKANHIEQQIEAVKSNIRALVDSPLIFTLASSLRPAAVTLIESEVESQQVRAAQDTVSDLKKHLVNRANKAKFETKIAQFLETEASSFLDALSRDLDAPELHAVSPIQAAELMSLFTDQADSAHDQLLQAMDELDSLEEQLSETARDLAKAPDEEALSDLINKLQAKNQDLGRLQQELASVDENKRKTSNLMDMLTRELEKLEKVASASAKQQEKLTYLQKIGPALDVYKKRLTKAKIETLKEEVTECFNRLARKSEFVHGVEIDPETFSVSLRDAQGRSIPREDLSSGEKQIFAIAMLWGLARTSGRSLPVVIDTPLGRLDSDHRKKLINEYFPNASHQVILLSTDTEVDQDLYKDLQPHISESYHLQYDQKKGHTTAESGYFWKNQSRKKAKATS